MASQTELVRTKILALLEEVLEKATFREMGKSEDPEDGEDTMVYLCPTCQEEIWGESGLKVRCETCLKKLLEEDELFRSLPESCKAEFWEVMERHTLKEMGEDQFLS